MASRTWIAITLCFGIWFVYLKWYAPVAPTQIAATQQSGTPGQPSSAANPSVGTTQVGGTGTLLGLSFTPGKDLELSNGKLDLSFSDTGGKISEARSTHYRIVPKKGAPQMPVLTPTENPYSLATLFTDPALAPFSIGKYQRTGTGTQVHFELESGGAKVEKEFSVLPNSAFVNVTQKITVPDPKRKDWGYLLIPVGSPESTFDAREPLKGWELIRSQNESVTRVHADKILDAEKVEQGNTAWIAYGNRYFTTAIVNQAEINPDVVLSRYQGFIGAYLRYPLILKEGQTQISIPVRYYLGAKDLNELESAGMKGVIDYGMFSVIAAPLLWLLRMLYSVIHNYGVAIILLTIVVRMLFYPLTVKSQRSMKAMQKLQPQIAALKEKYKDDMTRLNTEQMALFKTHKVNPMGGCLPMLVQLPVFIALYAVLGNSIELFQAPFFGWIQDLSSKDPFYIYPVLMGVAMFFQQRLTPNAGMDPAQQKMMMFMPVIFSFMMVNLPAGLTMYIFVSTLLGVVQQVTMRDPASAPVKVTA